VKVKAQSNLEIEFEFNARAIKLPAWECQYHGIPGRKFAFDFAWPDKKVAVEINGQIWCKGGHSSGVGLIRDYEKLNLAQANGWRVFQFHSGQVHNSLDAVDFMKEVLCNGKML